jgi:hypothetical protein
MKYRRRGAPSISNRRLETQKNSQAGNGKRKIAMVTTDMTFDEQLGNVLLL